MNSTLKRVEDTVKTKLSDIGESIVRALFLIVVAMSVLSVVVCISVLVYYYLKSIFVPKRILNEPIYFDFSRPEGPLARISLVSSHRQWDLFQEEPVEHSFSALTSTELEDLKSLSVKSKHRAHRFFQCGTPYSFDANIVLTKSERNRKLGKVMLFVTSFDSHQGAVMRAVRPIVVPYQSSVTRALDAVVLYPWRLLGVVPASEDTSLSLSLLDHFVDPCPRSQPPTHYLELRLSSPDVDMASFRISIIPSLRGIA